MGILDAFFAPFAAAGAQVNQTIVASQPVTSSGAPYAQPAVQQQASSPAPSINPVAVIESAYQTYVAPSVQTAQQVIPTIVQNAAVAAPTLVPPVAIGVAALSLLTPSKAVTPQYQGADLGGYNAPISIQPQIAAPALTTYDNQALQAVQGRAGYTPTSELGGESTQRALGGYKLLQENIALMGGTVAPVEMQAGRILEAQRATAPTTREQQFYSGELSKWAENAVELGSAYHVVSKAATIPIPANRYEYQADLAVEFLKGSPTKSSEYFSPVSGGMAAYLPSGKGVQQVAWDVAKTGEVSKVSFAPAVEKLVASQGVYGPYGALWGGPEYKETGANAKQYVAPALQGAGFSVKSSQVQPVATLPEPFISSTVVTTPAKGDIFGVTIPGVSNVLAFFQPASVESFRYGGKTSFPTTTIVGTPEVTTRQVLGGTETITTTPVTTIGGESRQVSTVAKQDLSGWDKLQLSVSESIQGILPKGSLEGIRMQEKISGGIAKESPTPLNLFGASGISEEKTFVEKPLESAASYAIGFGFGALAKGVEAGYMGARAATAETIISKGGMYRAAEQYGATIMGRAPQVLGAVYALDIGARSTEGFKSFEPVGVMQRAVPILTFETAPMTAGFMAPTELYKAVRLSDIGYKSALQEGTATGRINYYVTQPLTGAAKGVYQTVTAPITRFGLEYPQFAEEGKGASGYLSYKVGQVYRPVEISAKAFVQEMPGKVTGIQESIVKARVLSEPILEAGISNVYMKTSGFAYTLPETAYSKYFGTKLAASTQIGIVVDRAGISIKSLAQEMPEVIAGRGIPSSYTTIGPFGRSLLPTEKSIVEAMYAPRLSKILAPSTFGERAPMPQLPSTGGERRGGVATTTSPATPGFDRVVKTSKGFGLAKEPSLKSMGQTIGTPPMKEGVGGIARTTDFRGRPTSPTMKPMGEKATGVKQATGVSLLTEQLPVVEGLTTGRTAMREPVSQFYGAPSLQQSQRGEQMFVEVIEPSLEFAQTSKTRQESALVVSPAFMSAGIVAQAPRIDTRTSFAQVSEQASRSALGSISTTELSRRTSLDLSRSSDYDRISVPRVSTRERVDVTPRIDQIIDTRQTQKTSSITDITKKSIITVVPPPPIPSAPLLPGGGGAGGAKNPFRKIQREILYIGPRAPMMKVKRKKK